MTSTRAKPIRRPVRPHPDGEATSSVRHDPAGLERPLRELAAEAHRAVRAQFADVPGAVRRSPSSPAGPGRPCMRGSSSFNGASKLSRWTA